MLNFGRTYAQTGMFHFGVTSQRQKTQSSCSLFIYETLHIHAIVSYLSPDPTYPCFVLKLAQSPFTLASSNWVSGFGNGSVALKDEVRSVFLKANFPSLSCWEPLWPLGHSPSSPAWFWLVLGPRYSSSFRSPSNTTKSSKSHIILL